MTTLWKKYSGSSWINQENDIFIIKDSIIGYLVYKSKDYFYNGGLDYQSFDTLKEAKKFGKNPHKYYFENTVIPMFNKTEEDKRWIEKVIKDVGNLQYEVFYPLYDIFVVEHTQQTVAQMKAEICKNMYEWDL